MATRRGPARWIVPSLLLSVALWGLYRFVVRLADAGSRVDVNRLLLPALSLVLVVLALGLSFIMIRNLVRLIVDRKRGILGSRLRTKLVFFLLALVILPATVLFTGSAQVIKQTVEANVRTPLDDLTQKSNALVAQWSDYFSDQSRRRAEDVATAIVRDELLWAPEAEVDALLQQWPGLDPMQYTQVRSGDRIVARVGGLGGTPLATLQDDIEELVRPLADRAAAEGIPGTSIDYLGNGLLAYSAVPLIDRNGGARGSVAVGIVLPTRLAGQIEGLDEAAQAYKRFRAQRQELVRFYLSLIGVIFLVTLFAATWIGFYLARRITEPIRELAGAAREISAGNLSVRVRSAAGDETATLIEAFNEMAAELQENREVITRSTGELRRSNRALDERRRYIETLVANLSTAVVSLDTDGRVTTTNPVVHSILGLDLDIGLDAAEVLRAAGLDPLAELLDQARAVRTPTRRDLNLSRDEGAGGVNVSVHVSPLRGSAGEDLGTLVMVEDLTELVRAQRASAWREVARRIAHEIKNPLTPIQLAAQRLFKKFSEKSPDLDRVLPECTKSIEHEVGALKQLVDEFSRFARMPEMAPREVEFGEIVASVLALYKGDPDVHWDVSVEPEPCRVVVDPDQMRRVLINLIDNAVAAMDGEGTIRISVRIGPGDRLMLIEVADDGPGIPPEDKNKMFSPYFSTKRRGTGLGLAIVHKIITDHHGTIRVEDHPPRGAKFVIEVPVRSRKEVA